MTVKTCASGEPTNPACSADDLPLAVASNAVDLGRAQLGKVAMLTDVPSASSQNIIGWGFASGGSSRVQPPATRTLSPQSRDRADRIVHERTGAHDVHGGTPTTPPSGWTRMVKARLKSRTPSGENSRSPTATALPVPGWITTAWNPLAILVLVVGLELVGG
jgi:hypothetical protein